MTSLETLDLCGCLKLDNLPLLGNISVSSYYLDSLIFLDLSFCNLRTVPDAIGELRNLERLNLEGNNFVSLPSSMSSLFSLAYLNLGHCSRLQSLPEFGFCATSTSGGRNFKTVPGSHNHSSRSSRPEIQLPYNWYEDEEEIKPKFQLHYNWHVTEEEEHENTEISAQSVTGNLY
ncbi:putative TIR-NBS-LRR resistance protein [Trifolium pratense]|uniref:Putative TIR-NBS-LRR resistance protein n=1 Tax=Trifolium pratense TaxID=57577 RepID=A0A2K3L776_TRIPR|nr:putative TIR-NBS-LRR resistance protein [Trifolium pratense]